MSNMHQKPEGLRGEALRRCTWERGAARCPCVQASEAHVSAVEAAARGGEMIDCSTDVGDVCSGSLKLKIPAASQCLREVREERQG